MFLKIISKIFNFRKNIKAAFIKTLIAYIILSILLFAIAIALYSIKDIINKQSLSYILLKFFDKKNLKMILIYFASYSMLYLGIIAIANMFHTEEEYKKDKNETNIFLWNERTKKGNWKRVQKEFIESTKGKANWILGHKIDAKTGKRTWIVNKKDTHAKIIGGTGSGKSQYLVLPNIAYNASLDFKEKPCMFITDPKKEIYHNMSNFLADNDYEIKMIDLIEQHGEMWNPLTMSYEKLNSKPYEELKAADYEKAVSSINEIVEDLGWLDSKNDIWVVSSKSILTAIYLYMLLKTVDNPLFKKEKIERIKEHEFTILNASNYLKSIDFKTGKWREEIDKMSKHNIYWKRVSDILNNLPSKADNTLDGMLSNAQSVINEYAKSYTLSETLASSSLKLQSLFDNMEEKPFALFICYPDEEEAVNKFNSLFVKQLYKYATAFANKQKGKHLPRKLQFYLEEFANLVRIDNFDKSISIARSRWIFFLIIIQSYAQLKKYDTGKGESTTIIDNTSLTYFISSSSVETMESVIKSLGSKEVISKSISHNDKGASFSTNEQEKSIFTINDLKEKPGEDILIDIPNEKPFLWSMTPFYKAFKNIINDEREFEYKVSDLLKQIRYERENKVIQELNYFKEDKVNIKADNWEIKEKIMSNDFAFTNKTNRNAFLFNYDKLLLNKTNFKEMEEDIKIKMLNKSLERLERRKNAKRV